MLLPVLGHCIKWTDQPLSFKMRIADEDCWKHRQTIEATYYVALIVCLYVPVNIVIKRCTIDLCRVSVVNKSVAPAQRSYAAITDEDILFRKHYKIITTMVIRL